jgi:hypothetical protein
MNRGVSVKSKDGECATVAECVGRMWNVTPPSASCGTPPAACPASFVAAQGAACVGDVTADDPDCAYDEGLCVCLPAPSICPTEAST